MDKWYKVYINWPSGENHYVCQLEQGLEDTLKKNDEFVKLINIRWLKTKKKKTVLVKMEEPDGEEEKKEKYSNIMYLRKSLVEAIVPLQDSSIYNEKN